MNDAIKNAIIKYLENHELINDSNKESFYKDLLCDMEQVSTLRKDLDNSMVDLKREIIKSNIILLFEKIFKNNTPSRAMIDIRGSKQRLVYATH